MPGESLEQQNKIIEVSVGELNELHTSILRKMDFSKELTEGHKNAVENAVNSIIECKYLEANNEQDKTLTKEVVKYVLHNLLNANNNTNWNTIKDSLNKINSEIKKIKPIPVKYRQRHTEEDSEKELSLSEKWVIEFKNELTGDLQAIFNDLENILNVILDPRTYNRELASAEYRKSIQDVIKVVFVSEKLDNPEYMKVLNMEKLKEIFAYLKVIDSESERDLNVEQIKNNGRESYKALKKEIEKKGIYNVMINDRELNKFLSEMTYSPMKQNVISRIRTRAISVLNVVGKFFQQNIEEESIKKYIDSRISLSYYQKTHVFMQKKASKIVSKVKETFYKPQTTGEEEVLVENDFISDEQENSDEYSTEEQGSNPNEHVVIHLPGAKYFTDTPGYRLNGTSKSTSNRIFSTSRTIISLISIGLLIISLAAVFRQSYDSGVRIKFI